MIRINNNFTKQVSAMIKNNKCVLNVYRVYCINSLFWVGVETK